MGSGPEQVPRGSRILERHGRTIRHYLEGVEDRPSRRREFLAAAGRPQRPRTRRQPSSMSYFDMPYLTLSGHDGQTTTSLTLTRQKKHQPMSALHPIINRRLGRQALPTPRQRRLEARPGARRGTRREVRKTLYRSLHISGEHPTTIEYKMEKPVMRSRGHALLIVLRLAQGKQVVQPLMAPPTQPREETAPKRFKSHNGYPYIDMQGQAPNAYRDGLRGINCRAPSKLVPTRASGNPQWAVIVFRVLFRPSSTEDEEL
jgi:hypothetical protein